MTRAAPLSREQATKAMRLVRKGYTDPAVAEMLGLTVDLVREGRRRRGIKHPPGRPKTSDGARRLAVSLAPKSKSRLRTRWLVIAALRRVRKLLRQAGA